MQSTSNMADNDSGSDSYASVHEATSNVDSVPSKKSMNGVKRIQTESGNDGTVIAIDDLPSDQSMPRPTEPAKPMSRSRRAWEKRVFVGGFRMIPLAIIATCFAILCGAAILIPTVYMGMGPTLAQKSVSGTYISLHNIRVSNWAYAPKNASDTCEVYKPSTMTITQDIFFEHIPWYGHLGPTYIQPSVLDLSYNGTVFAQLYLPKLDMTDVNDGDVWANNTVGTMVVLDSFQFIKANAQLLPLGITKGWTVWHQQSDIILQQTLLGITSYYPATMSQDVNVTQPMFLDGPVSDQALETNLFEALMCVTDITNAAE